MIQLPTDYTKLSITDKRIVREQYIILQKNKCMYCNKSLFLSPPSSILSKPINWNLFPPNFLKHPIHLQHNHDTNMTEGVVHAYCNAVLWQYENK